MMDSVAKQMGLPDTGDVFRRAYDFKYKNTIKLFHFATPKSLNMHKEAGKVHIGMSVELCSTRPLV